MGKKKRQRGWFQIDGVQDGERTPEGQCEGLSAALAGVRGKTVLDLGCAEGAIAALVCDAGAVLVHGVENNLEMLKRAREWYSDPRLSFFGGDLNDGLPVDCLPRYDVVLLLAIVHKMLEPTEALRNFAAAARSCVIIRLPFGSRGSFYAKHGSPHEFCDTRATMLSAGFALEAEVPGPRGEMVHYWRRTNEHA